MKIAIVHGPGFYYNGGGERIVIEETKGLRERGYNVDVYSTHVETAHCFPEETEKLGIIPFFRNLNLPLQAAVNMTLSAVIYPLIKRRLRSYDVLICHSQPAIWIGYKTEKPYVAYIHRPNCFLYPKPVDQWNFDVNMFVLDKIVRSFPLSQELDLISTRAADEILTTSQWIADWTNRIYGVASVRCPPAPSSVFQHENPVRIWWRHSSSSDRPRLLTVTRHVPIKRLDWTLNVFSRLCQEFECASLTIVGRRTSHTESLLKLAESLKVRHRIALVQDISDARLLDCYQSADLYLSCAPMEDFGIAPLEAMATGLPVVVWSFGGTAELVEDGITGFKARAYDLNDLYKKTVGALSLDEDEYRRLSLNAIAKANEYTWKRHVDIVEEAVQELAD